jgi:hypothetical protein
MGGIQATVHPKGHSPHAVRKSDRLTEMGADDWRRENSDTATK